VPFFRALLVVFAIAVCLCVAIYIVTSNRRYLNWAWLLLKLAIVAGLLFFAVLLLERIV